MPAEQSCLPHGRVADFARLVIAERILASLADVFEQPKRVAVIKGIAAAYRLYDDPIERPFVDIDLLTTPRYARTLLGLSRSAFILCQLVSSSVSGAIDRPAVARRS